MSDLDTTALDTLSKELTSYPPLITRERAEQKLEQRTALDPHFARISLEFASRLVRRPELEPRLRFLVQIGMFTVTRSGRHLEDALRAGMPSIVPARDALEAIFLAHVYAGDTVVDPALEIFAAVATELDVLDQLKEGQVPIDRRDRVYEEERSSWPDELIADSRLEHLIDLFGWQGVSTGFRYRGIYHLDSLEYLERLDLGWGQLWEAFTYEGIYSRGVFDDKTRLLCTLGDSIALGASGAVPTKEHMEEALDFGNSPREVLEVLYMSGLHLGFPTWITVRNVFVRIMSERGQLAEIGNVPTPKPIDERR